MKINDLKEMSFFHAIMKLVRTTNDFRKSNIFEKEYLIMKKDESNYTNEKFIIHNYFVNVGDTLKLTGKIVTHQDYGEQFKVDTFEKMMPKTLGALERYLANGTIKGVGPATAKKIIGAPYHAP